MFSSWRSTAGDDEVSLLRVNNVLFRHYRTSRNRNMCQKVYTMYKNMIFNKKAVYICKIYCKTIKITRSSDKSLPLFHSSRPIVSAHTHVHTLTHTRAHRGAGPCKTPPLYFLLCYVEKLQKKKGMPKSILEAVCIECFGFFGRTGDWFGITFHIYKFL